MLFGIALAGMNTAFYLSLDRIPLGIAVTLEFVGPLGVAIAGSRRRLDLVWAGLAALGIALLVARPRRSTRPRRGGARRCSPARSGPRTSCLRRGSERRFAGGGGLALAVVVAAALSCRPGSSRAAPTCSTARRWRWALAVALLSSVIPYSLELEALRRLPTAVFGVLMSLEPAVAAAVGFVALDQGLGLNEALAIACVVAASAGALRERAAAGRGQLTPTGRLPSRP